MGDCSGVEEDSLSDDDCEAEGLILAGATIAVEGVSVVLMSGLQGAGDTRRTMVVAATFQWLLFLPLAYLIGPVLGYGLLAIWSLQGVYRALLASVYMVLWRQGGWAAIKV